MERKENSNNSSVDKFTQDYSIPLLDDITEKAWGNHCFSGFDGKCCKLSIWIYALVSHIISHNNTDNTFININYTSPNINFI